MKPNTPNIAEIRAMVAAATPGPWKAYSSHYGSEVATNESIYSWICQLWYKDEEVMQNHKNNAHLIAKAPETITALCDEVERQSKEIAAMQKIFREQDEEIDRLRKALEFYENWNDLNTVSQALEDKGQRAREALRRDTPNER